MDLDGLLDKVRSAICSKDCRAHDALVNKIMIIISDYCRAEREEYNDGKGSN